MSDLSDFLLARIAEDEGRLVHEFDCDRFEVYNYGTRRGECDCDATARLLAECDAKRRIVEDLQEELANQHDPEPTTLQLAERMLLALALPYADRPDYREEWKP